MVLISSRMDATRGDQSRRATTAVMLDALLQQIHALQSPIMSIRFELVKPMGPTVPLNQPATLKPATVVNKSNKSLQKRSFVGKLIRKDFLSLKIARVVQLCKYCDWVALHYNRALLFQGRFAARRLNEKKISEFFPWRLRYFRRDFFARTFEISG